jgi:hypothetical protein
MKYSAILTQFPLAMKKQLLSIFSILSLSVGLHAQTTQTHVVADNPAAVASCVDSTITLAEIMEIAGIHDLNDPNDDVSMYKMFRLAGSVITTDELTSVRYSDYPAVFIKKMNATDHHKGGVSIFTRITTRPTHLFTVDTLKYTVEKNATVNFTPDFFSKFVFFSSGNDLTNLYDRILFTDQSIGTEAPIGINNSWSIVGKGRYKIKVQVAVCNPTDYYYDSIYVIVNETPCLKLEIKNMPSVCRDEVIDITPYVYLDDHVATSSELAQMTFINTSLASNHVNFDPTALDMSEMVDNISRIPQLQMKYQPNVDLGVCTNSGYLPALKVPTVIPNSTTVLTKNNQDKITTYSVNGDYYGFNNIFSKDVFKKLYLDNFNVHAGTTFDFYSDATLETPVTGNNLTVGTYQIIATNPDCSDDITQFTVNVKEKDFDIVWKSAPAIGKGYYTFTAPITPGATYAWFVWGGSIISGNNTNQITVYFSETASPSVLASCTITLIAPTARTTEENSPKTSAVYLTSNDNGDKEEITSGITTSIFSRAPKSSLTAYPNPATETFALSGSGIYDVKIYNTLGQLVYTNVSYKAETPITVSNKGMHVVYITQNGMSQVVKVIVE